MLNAINDLKKVHTVVTRKGWTYRVLPVSFTVEGDVATFKSAVRGDTGWDRVAIRLDEIATVVESDQ